MALTPGSRLGPYEVLAKLGEGGMGEVYRARDVRLDRDVAIKVLAETLTDPISRVRFGQEARAVAALSHPNILALFDVGNGDPPYLVTELLHGETLRARLDRGALALDETLDVARQLAAGLSAAHAQGIIHRDLKPENVFVTREGVVKILDFGLARTALPVISDDDATRAPATMSGTILGTVGYMAPEQVRGAGSDQRSDVFAFGAVVYEMVRGHRAFEGPSPADTISAILREQPRALTTDGEMPSGVSRFIQRCLEKEPERRFRSANDLALELNALAAADPGAPAAHGDSLAVLPFTNVGGADAEYLSEGIAESLTNTFSQIGELHVVPRSVVARYKGQAVDPRLVGRELGVRMLLSGKVVERGGRLSVQVELVDAVANKQLWGDRLHRPLADIFEVEEEITRQIADKLRVRLSGEEKKQLARRYTENSEAYQLYLKSRFHFLKRTVEGLEKAIQYCQQAIELDPDFALAHAALTDCCLVLAALAPSAPKAYHERARIAASRAVESDPTLAEAHNALAYVRACCDWDWTGAEASFRRALELSPASWITHDWYALTLSSQGKLNEALGENNRAQQLEPLSVVLHHHRAWLLVLARRYDDVIEQSRRTLEFDAGFGWAYLWMGLAFEQLSRRQEAIAALRTACDLTLGMPQAIGALAHALAMDGRRDDAELMLNRIGEQSPTGYREPFAVAIGYVGLGDTERAFEWLNKACADVSSFLTLFIKCDPRLDALRGDSRFVNLLRRMRLEH